jgi:hypothetical protein
MLHLNASRVAQLPFAGSSTGSEAMAVRLPSENMPKCLKKKDFSPN